MYVHVYCVSNNKVFVTAVRRVVASSSLAQSLKGIATAGSYIQGVF